MELTELEKNELAYERARQLARYLFWVEVCVLAGSLLWVFASDRSLGVGVLVLITVVTSIVASAAADWRAKRLYFINHHVIVDGGR